MGCEVENTGLSTPDSEPTSLSARDWARCRGHGWDYPVSSESQPLGALADVLDTSVGEGRKLGYAAESYHPRASYTQTDIDKRNL